MLRSSIQRIPARLVYNLATPVSLYAKEGTRITQDLVYEGVEVGAAGLGATDQRDREMHYRVQITPDGRLTAAIAALLYPYGNPTIGQGIFTDTDVTLSVEGSDGSLDTYTSAALEKMPELQFHPEKTLLGPAQFLCLRGSGADWSAANSLVTQANTGGAFADAGFASAGIITQNYTLTWGSVAGFATATDFYDGLTFQPSVTLEDDTPARYGLYNRRIKSVGGIVRGIPLGQTRQNILAALSAQGAGAARGGSRAASGATLTVTGADASTPLVLYGAALVDQKLAWGVAALRQGEIAWMATPTVTAGVRGAYFTVGAA
jgi:hypothetical protein